MPFIFPVLKEDGCDNAFILHLTFYILHKINVLKTVAELNACTVLVILLVKPIQVVFISFTLYNVRSFKAGLTENIPQRVAAQASHLHLSSKSHICLHTEPDTQ